MRISDWSSDVCSSDLVKRLYSLRTLPEDILAALKNCSPRAAVAIKHAIELDEQATRNFVAANENPTAAACEQFLATLQGSPEEETAQAGAAKEIGRAHV